MLDAEHARLLALENTTGDDFVVIAAVRRELGKLKRCLKISNTVDIEAHAIKPSYTFEPFQARQKTKTKRIHRTRQRI